MNNWIASICALVYLCVLFGVAYYAEYRLKKGKSIINNPYVYSLSLGVFCTAWTYYGSVGQASSRGIEFITVYIGPTIMAALFWPVLRKIIRICRTQRINSIADFISTRYGKNFSLAVLVTVLCVLGIIPYISLQLKAISTSIHVLSGDIVQEQGLRGFLSDNTFYIAIALSVFIILFGTRSIDASEKHEGLVAAVAFESVIKLVAFIAVGIFVTYGIFNGFGDIFSQASKDPALSRLYTLEPNTSYTSWFGLTLLSMLAIVFLPRQFQMGVVENLQESHLKKAIWMFPLYLLVINIFVIPVAFGGKLILGSGVHADTYVLSLPLHYGHEILGLFTFIGGFSAATSMIIVETIALSTMMSNNIATPILLKAKNFRPGQDGSLTRTILQIRRVSILLIITLAFVYDKLVAQHFSLVSIGLISFAAVAQFAPSVIGGIYWKHASQKGAMAGIAVGFVIWFYTAVVPSMANAGMFSSSITENGLFGLSWLRPTSLFGMQGMDTITHCFFWSMLFNIITFIAVSLNSNKTVQETYQAELFVDIFRHSAVTESNVIWKGTASIPDLNSLLSNFLGQERAEKLISHYAQRHKIPMDQKKADARLVTFAERVLSGVIGSASARIMVSTVTKEEEIRIDEVLRILQESQQMIELNKELRRKSSELQKATEQLTQANEQLREMDHVKDEFLYTVTHELRTPLTSIRAMAEIVHDNPDMPDEEKMQFLSGVIRETERLSHLITQVLNLERYESGRQKLNIASVQMNELLQDTIRSVEHLAREKKVDIIRNWPDSMFLVQCDAALIQQVVYNLLSNAIKFAPEGSGQIRVSMQTNHDELQVWVEDNGKGIPQDLHTLIFDKFFQARNQTLKKPEGTGLGLAICKKIVEMHEGKIWVDSVEGKGSRFIFTLPVH